MTIAKRNLLQTAQKVVYWLNGILLTNSGRNYETYNDVYKIRERMLMRLQDWMQLITTDEQRQTPVQHHIQPAAPRQRLRAIKIEPFSGDYTK